MLWYKSWLETRWRFTIGLALLSCSAAAVVFTRPEVVRLMPLVSAIDVGGEVGRRIRESAEVAREYRGYIWSQWFGQNLSQLGTLFAALLGTGGLLAQASGGGVLFTLSMPASRDRLLRIRALAGFAELFVIVFVPSLLIPLLSPAIGETYGVGNALIHSACAFIAGSAFFSLAFLLSTVFGDLWRPPLIVLLVAAALGMCTRILAGLSRYSIFAVMSGEAYFRDGRLPWFGLLVSAVASAAMLWRASLNIERRDF